MDKDFHMTPEMQIVVALNKGLMLHDADQALIMLCQFMKHHNLTARPEVVQQIPIGPGDRPR